MSRNLPFKARRVQIIDAFEQVYVRDLLDRCGWDVALAARASRLSRNQLLRLIGKHRLCPRCDGFAPRRGR